MKLNTNFEKDESIIEQLVQLRDVTDRTGGIHPLQIKNLYYWSYVVDPSLDYIEDGGVKVEAIVDSHYFEFHWKAEKPIKIDKAYIKRLQELKAAIKQIFGPKWTHKVFRNGQRIDNRSQPRGTRKAGRDTKRKRKVRS